jgi:hypothetical protein
MTEVNQRIYSAATSEFFNEIRHEETLAEFNPWPNSRQA